MISTNKTAQSVSIPSILAQSKKVHITSQYLSDEGGIHLTSHAFLPNALLKELSATEDQFYSGIVNFDNQAMVIMVPRISQPWHPFLLITGASEPGADQALHSLLQGIFQENDR